MWEESCSKGLLDQVGLREIILIVCEDPGHPGQYHSLGRGFEDCVSLERAWNAS